MNTYEMSLTQLHSEVQEIREKFEGENLSYKQKIELNKRLRLIETEIEERYLDC
jgi:hypothetical protein